MSAFEESVVGTVTECLPDLKYRVEIPQEGKEPVLVIAYLAGKMKLHKIKVLVGDRVEVVLDPYKGKATNRIVRRK